MKENIRFYNAEESPLKVYGMFKEDGQFRRIPQRVAETINEDIVSLSKYTAGGRIRFRTDSTKVTVNVTLSKVGRWNHWALTGSAGFDMYTEEEGGCRYVGTFRPPYDVEDTYEQTLEFSDRKLRNILIHFPLYSSVQELYIGLEETCRVLEPLAYKIEKPVVFYGSSITQGACASRPGNTYQSILSRKLHFNFINLGFSNAARAETEIAEYIKNINMSAFVYDYDHNAPTVEYLAKTHERMFKIIREANPKLPILCMSMPKYYLTESEKKRLEIMNNTYQNAKANGDANVYLLDGKQLMFLAEDEGTVDGIHPNDLGYASMARAMEKVLKDILY